MSAKTLPVGRERNIHIATFVLLGVVGVVLIVWQGQKSSAAYYSAVEASRTASQQQKTLEDKLDRAQGTIIASQLSQERMRGQLDGIELILGKISTTNSGGLKDLVGAISKISDTGHSGMLTNKQLCDRTKALTKRIREFAEKMDQDNRAQLDTEMQAMGAASTEDERKKVWSEQTQALMRLSQQHDFEFRNDLFPEIIFLRDQMLQRVSIVPAQSHAQKFMFQGILAGVHYGLYDGADYLEQLAKTLCP